MIANATLTLIAGFACAVTFFCVISWLTTLSLRKAFQTTARVLRAEFTTTSGKINTVAIVLFFFYVLARPVLGFLLEFLRIARTETDSGTVHASTYAADGTKFLVLILFSLLAIAILEAIHPPLFDKDGAVGRGRAPSEAGKDEVEARVEKLERRMASRLDLSQFGYLTIRQTAMLAGQDYDKTRKSWTKKCESCAAAERGERHARLHDPWKVAAVLEAEGITPRWGVLALQHCHKAVTETRKLNKQQSESLGSLLGRWFEEYTVPPEFTGARGDADRDDIKAQITLNLTQYVGEGVGLPTQEEFDRAAKQAEAAALEWWKQKILRSRSRENPLSARDGDGEDVTGRLDSFEAPEADDS